MSDALDQRLAGLRRATLVAKVAMATVGLVAFAKAVILSGQLSLLRTIASGSPVDMGLASLADFAVAKVNLVEYGAVLVAALAFARWLWVGLRDAEALAVTAPLPSPTSALVSLFVPGVNLVRPAQTTMALLAGYHPDHLPPPKAAVTVSATTAYRDNTVAVLSMREGGRFAPVALWWSFWVAARFLAVLSLALEGNGDVAESLYLASAVSMAAELLTALSAVAGWRVLSAFFARAEGRVERLVWERGV